MKLKKSAIRGSITNSQNIKDFPRHESLWDIMVPYVPLHSPVGALLLVFQCLKKVSDPEGFWLDSSRVFGDANFFSDRRELIEKSEEWVKTQADLEPGWFISSEMTSDEVNRWLIQDLIVEYSEEYPPIGELYRPWDGGSGDDKPDTTIYHKPNTPKIVKIWPFYFEKGWRVIYYQPNAKWRPAILDNIVSLIQILAFQTWLGYPATSMDFEKWGGGGKVIPLAAPIRSTENRANIDEKSINSNETNQIKLLKNRFRHKQDVKHVLTEAEWMVKIFNDPRTKKRYRWMTREYPDIGILLTSLALHNGIIDDLRLGTWTGYYETRYQEQKGFLMKYLGVTAYVPSRIRSIYPSKTKKKTLRFVPETKDNQNNRRPKKRFSFGGW